MPLLKTFLLFTLFILASCSEKRTKDIDEVVLTEYIQEKNGFYHVGDCEEHIGKKVYRYRKLLS